MMETPDTLIEALHRKLRELSFMEMSADARTIVSDLLTLTDTPCNAVEIDIHRPTFDGLIRLAGPLVAPELLRQLGNDLVMVEDGLTAALAAQDTQAIRRQTHVLIALAGSVGAEGLLQMAKDLNLRAHLPQRPDMTMLGHRLLFCTAQVRAFVLQQQANLGRTAENATVTVKGASEK